MFLWPFSWPQSVPLPSEETHLHDNPQSLASILLHYTTPGVAPPSARSDPKLKLQARQPVRLLDLWKFGVIAVVKATEIAGAILAHNIYGPKKRSWGIEMTIINTLMRGANRHSALVDIGTIRMAMGLAGLVPLPSDALVTPVTFNVRKRNLRGILAEFDAQETGKRELSGEWVVGRHTWLRLQDEWKNSKGSKTHEHKKKKERVILYIHGGAYYASSSVAQRIISIPLAKYTDARVFALDYRLAPECKFPCSLHDAVSGYFRLVVDLHIPTSSIVIAGDSAGGALSIALLMYLRDNQYELPAAAILMSPWVDLTMSCESWDSNEPYDVIPMLPPDSHLNPIQLYLGDNMEQYMTHPYASPLFGNFEGLPPMLIQSGDSEVLRDEITLLAHKATLAGVEVRHELYEDAIHVFQLYPFLEATTKSFVSMRDFVRKFLAQIELDEPQEQLNEETEKVLEDEIEGESVIMVGGDGLKTASGLAGVKLSVALQGATFADSSSDTEEEGAHVSKPPKEFSSWGPRSWGFSKHSSSPNSTPTSSTRRRAGTVPSSPVLAGTYPASLSPRPTTPRTRSQSHVTQRTHLPPSLSSRRSGLPPRINITNNNFIRKTESLREPIHSRSSATSPLSPQDGILPSPSIRRSSRTSSHQDLYSLVDQWNNQGPANRTLIYPLSRS